MSKPFSVFLMLLLSTVAYAQGSEIRKENLGDVEGTLKIGHVHVNGDKAYMMTEESLYTVFLSPRISRGGFAAKMPLQVSLHGPGSSLCPSYFLDKEYPYSDIQPFAQTHLGARVRLKNVQQVYVNNKRTHCSFTEFDVIATRQALAQQRDAAEKARMAQIEQADQERKRFTFSGDLKATLRWPAVHYDGIIKPVINSGGITSDEFNHYCGGNVTFEQAMAKQRLHDIKNALRFNGGKATLTNVRIADGKCTVEDIVPH